MFTQAVFRTFAAASTLLATAAVHAQWSVVNLNPTSAPISRALASNGSVQAGVVEGAGFRRAGVWYGTSASFIQIDSVSSQVNAARSNSFVGYTQSGSRTAALWTGPGFARVSLNPAGSSASEAFGVDENQQVGQSFVSGTFRASLWSGTAASWINLNPLGATQSSARAVAAGQQVGYATISGQEHAGFWSGTANSWTSLHPTGASSSAAFATDGVQQGGSVFLGGFNRAAMWTGSASSFVDLSPIGSFDSGVASVGFGFQVGHAFLSSDARASIWNGTRNSWFNLHDVLPSGFRSSYATGLSTDGSFVYVTGYGFNEALARDQALLWVRPIPSPSSAALLGLAGLVACRRRR